MLIDLSKLLTHEGKQQQVEILPSGDTFSCELGEFSYGENEPVLLTIKHKENQILNDEEIDMKLSEEERIEALDESSFIQNKELDTDKLLHNEVLINWPMRVLCKEDCKGICSRCGANLNQGSCDCDTADLDPRMAVISDIFKNFKEV